MGTEYDRVHYPSLPHIDLQPPNLGAIAMLLGHSATKRSGYRVLEIGCGEGVNLMSMALSDPTGSYVGIDLAQSAIASGQALVRATGFRNIELYARNILEPGEELGTFDYVVVHGVYAWVGEVVQTAIMRLIGDVLRPGGIAVISYNVLPGCRIRQGLRDMLKTVTAGLSDPDEVIARGRAFLNYQISGWNEADPYQHAMRMEAKGQLAKPAGVLFHDELGEVYAPQMLQDVVAGARAAGLDYLCDASARLLEDALFPGEQFEAARAWSGGDWVAFEQMLDFTLMRRFRRSMFVRAGEVGDRLFQPGRFVGLYADGEIKPASDSKAVAAEYAFTFPKDGEVTTKNAEVANMLTTLGEIFPHSMPLDHLATGGPVVEPLMQAICAGAIGLRLAPHIFTFDISDKPHASPLARAQAARGDEQVASLRGGAARLGDEGIRALLLLLDGTRTIGDIAATMAMGLGVPVAEAGARLPAVLAHLARLGLLMTPDAVSANRHLQPT